MRRTRDAVLGDEGAVEQRVGHDGAEGDDQRRAPCPQPTGTRFRNFVQELVTRVRFKSDSDDRSFTR